MNPSDRPTSVRWWVLGVTTLASVLLYLDRVCIGFVAKSIEVDFDAVAWDGIFQAIFFYPYALCQVPAGMLSARFGIRRMLVIYILSWSLLTAVLGLANGLWMLLLFRLGFGMAQAGAYPCAARAVRDWMPLHWRGTASSIVAFGGRAGGSIAPALTAQLMLFFALQIDGPAFLPSELIDPKLLLDRIAVDTVPPDGWQRRLAAGWSDTGPEADRREQLVQHVNSVDVVAELSQAADRPSLPLEVRNVLDGAERVPPQSSFERARINRQLWELLAPQAFKKLEARGWRLTLALYGAVGLLVAWAFWITFRELPSEHPRCNAAECSLITAVAVSTSAAAAPPFPWRLLLTNPSMWGNCLAQFGTNVGWVFVAFTLPRYLEEVHHVPVLQRGYLSMLPSITGMVALLFGGAATDLFTRRVGLRWGRRLPIVLTRCVAASSYVLCVVVLQGAFGPLAGTLALVAALIGVCLASGFTDLGVPATWAFSQDVGGRHTAAILGWGNMWGNLGAAVALNFAGDVLGKQPGIGEWTNVFLISSSGFVLAAVGALLMDASRPLVEQ